MAEYAKELAAFLNASHSNFHAVVNLKKALERLKRFVQKLEAEN